MGTPFATPPNRARKWRIVVIERATIAHKVVELAESRQAHDIMLLDIGELTTIAEYFIICSGDNERQLKAIVEHIDESIHTDFDIHPRIEGSAATGWIVLDYNFLIVHVFGAEQREYYQLERLWSKATPVVVVQ